MDGILSRRGFVATSAAGAARVLGANDRVRLGIIGTGGRGTHLIRMAGRNGGCEFVAVCDAWDVRRREGKDAIAKALPRPTIGMPR
jgi:predicted homoserine dehydrogenase-like protein